MFDAQITASTFATVVDTAEVLVDECKITLDSEGLQIRAVDPANVGMVDIQVDQSAFTNYECDNEVLGVDLSRLSDFIGVAESDDLVNFELVEDTGKLQIRTAGFKGNMALIDPGSIRDEPTIPDLDFPAEVVLTGRDLSRAVEAATMVSDHITIGVDEEDATMYFLADGDTDSVDFRLSEEDVASFNAGPAESIYSLDYLSDVVKSIPSQSEVTTKIGSDIPILFSVVLGDSDIAVTYVLAPRVQS